MNIPQIYLVEPYNAYAPKGKKKHLHEILEEQALLARIMAEQQARQDAELQAFIQEAKSRTLPPQAPPESVPTIVGNTAGAGAEGQAGSAPGGGGMPAWDFWNPSGDTVNFNRSPSTGAGPLTVNFTNLTTTPQFDSYKWEFTKEGVTVTSTDINPVMVFQTGSTDPVVVTASLQVTNSVTGAPGGRSPNVYTLVSIPTVTAAFTYTTTSNVAPMSASFVNTSTTDSGPLTYRWTFTYTNAAGAATTTTSAVPSGYTRRIDSGSFTTSLQATGSYGIASIVSYSFVAPAPTLALSLSLATLGTVSPAMVTIRPTVTYNGIGTPYGYPYNNFNRWWYGEFSEAGAEYSSSYSGDTSRTYDTRSDAGGTTVGQFTASLCLTESVYGIAVRATQSFYIPMPTLSISLMVTSESNYSPSRTTFTPTVFNNGAGTLNGQLMLGEFTENGDEYYLPYSAGPLVYTYDTRSGVNSTGSFTASLQLIGSNYGVTAFVTQSIPLLFPSLNVAFVTNSFGFDGVENSYMEPVTMSYTSSNYWNGSRPVTVLWDFGSASFFATALGTQTGTTASIGPHLRADYGPGNYTASLQMTGSYGITGSSSQMFQVNT